MAPSMAVETDKQRAEKWLIKILWRACGDQGLYLYSFQVQSRIDFSFLLSLKDEAEIRNTFFLMLACPELFWG